MRPVLAVCGGDQVCVGAEFRERTCLSYLSQTRIEEAVLYVDVDLELVPGRFLGGLGLLFLSVVLLDELDLHLVQLLEFLVGAPGLVRARALLLYLLHDVVVHARPSDIAAFDLA